jgi:glycerol dehydrogenase
MRMIAMKVPENYLQQAGVLNKVGEYVAPLARRVLIVAGGHALGVAGDARPQPSA